MAFPSDACYLRRVIFRLLSSSLNYVPCYVVVLLLRGWLRLTWMTLSKLKSEESFLTLHCPVDGRGRDRTNIRRTRRGSIRSSLRTDGLSTPYRLTKEQCSTVTPCPSCTEFVYPGCWHFDHGKTSKIWVLLWYSSFMSKSYGELEVRSIIISSKYRGWH